MEHAIQALGGIGTVINFGFAILTIALNALLATAVFRDGEKLAEQGRGTTFVSSTWWTVAVLWFSLPGLAIYWAIHHSALRRD